MSNFRSSNTDPSRSNAPALPNHPLWEWSARIQFNKHELGCSFSVCLFLGEPPNDPEEWLTAPNFAGAHHAYVSGGGYGRNRSRPGGDIDEGFVNLNPAIVRLSGLGSFEPGVIVPYLTDQLHWRVQKGDTEPAELQSLEVVVFATPLSYLPGEMFPVPGEPRMHNEITHGKAGGSRDQV